MVFLRSFPASAAAVWAGTSFFGFSLKNAAERRGRELWGRSAAAVSGTSHKIANASHHGRPRKVHGSKDGRGNKMNPLVLEFRYPVISSAKRSAPPRSRKCGGRKRGINTEGRSKGIAFADLAAFGLKGRCAPRRGRERSAEGTRKETRKSVFPLRAGAQAFLETAI